MREHIPEEGLWTAGQWELGTPGPSGRAKTWVVTTLPSQAWVRSVPLAGREEQDAGSQTLGLPGLD